MELAREPGETTPPQKKTHKPGFIGQSIKLESEVDQETLRKLAHVPKQTRAELIASHPGKRSKLATCGMGTLPESVPRHVDRATFSGRLPVRRPEPKKTFVEFRGPIKSVGQTKILFDVHWTIELPPHRADPSRLRDLKTRTRMKSFKSCQPQSGGLGARSTS